jgi:hypothetical protein
MSLERLCSACGALPDRPCLSSSGAPLAVPHARRSRDTERSAHSHARNRERHRERAAEMKISTKQENQ